MASQTLIVKTRAFLLLHADLHKGMSRMQQFTPWVMILAALLMGLIALFTPIAYDTDHFGDTLFILDAGWRVHLGLTPTVDFNYFYGGVVAQVIAWAIGLFGPSAKAYDFAMGILFLG